MKLFKSFCRKLGITLLMLAVTHQAVADTVTYFYNDISGSPQAASDEAGNLLWRENYKPYGEKLNQSAPTGSNKVGFHGKEYDDATGLAYMGARYFDPVIGRFTGIDPVGYQEDSLNSFNRYAYTNNNPYKYVDPDGRVPILPFLAALFSGGSLLGVSDYANAPAVGENTQTMGPGESAAALAMVIPSSAAVRITAQAETAVGRVVGGQWVNDVGAVYLRTNRRTGADYIGQVGSPMRWLPRQAEHFRQTGEPYGYKILGYAPKGRELNVLEETYIRVYGGIRKRGGPLENKRHQMSPSNYSAAGGTTPLPY